MTAILGISAFYHDSAAALLVDGEIVAAAQEERFSRVKHDAGFPTQALAYCLAEAGLEPAELDYVGFYDKPLLKFDRLLETYLAFAPAGLRSFAKAMPVWLRQKLHVPRELRRALPGYDRRFVFPSHHESHAASAFYPSPFQEAAILTIDGVGEWATTTIGRGQDERIELLAELRFPHSLGLLYSAFTAYCGFRVNSGEYKLMGLAPYGEPRFAELIRSQLLDLKPDGSFRLDLRYFNYCQGLTMTNRRFAVLLGAPARTPESALTAHYMDVAASIQAVTEDIVLRLAQTAHERTGSANLCLAGGVALNCVANGRLLREGPFDALWIQPAAGDAGGALGAAQLIWHQLLEEPREVRPSDSMNGALLGPAYGDDDIRPFLDDCAAVYTALPDDAELFEQVAAELADEKVVGWFQGRMEYGPRALGSRSILGDARSAGMQSTMNLKIKYRESFRPFAPSALADRAAEYFELAPAPDSPYMLLVTQVAADKRQAPGEAATGLGRLAQVRSAIPAVTHVDDSARVQTVDAERHGRYHGLLEAFAARTGCPVVINTSFNVRGEPIVCSPADALRCFMATDMDRLVLGSFLLRKEDQPATLEVSPSEHLKRFAPD